MITKLTKTINGEKIRFLIIGAINTVLGTAIYSILLLNLNKFEYGYMAALILSQIISLFFGFYLHRKFTFKVKGNLIIDFTRFSMVSALSYAINIIILPILVSIGHWNPFYAQISILIITTLISFIGHKFFSFRRKQQHI